VWVRITVDGMTDAGRVFAAGERRDITGNRVSVRAGNAGALTVSADGAPVALFGPEGVPLTRDFAGPTATATPE
jgi:hypothetical protein